jgi:Spy/CpxP family protein refolding chaperone
MKKLIMMFVLATTLISINAAAQGGGDPAARMQQMKERMKPQLIEKAKLTDEQAEKVIEARFEAQRQLREVRNDVALDEAGKTKKNADVEAAFAKRLKEIPLTDEQVKAINEYLEERRKQMQNRGGGNGNG